MPSDPDDGINIINSREDFGGDLLVMLVADQGQPNGAGGFAGPFGIAMTQRRNCDFNGALTQNRDCDIGPAYKDFAFAAFCVLRLTDNFTFAHEVGHMLGSEHDRAGVELIDYQPWTTTPTSTDVIASFASSYGFRTPGSGGPAARMDVMGSPFCFPSTSTTNCWARDLQFADPGRIRVRQHICRTDNAFESEPRLRLQLTIVPTAGGGHCLILWGCRNEATVLGWFRVTNECFA